MFCATSGRRLVRRSDAAVRSRKNKGKNMRIMTLSLRWFSVWLALGLAIPGRLQATEPVLPTLQIGTVTYSNVTVYGKTDKDLYISHAGGLQNIKMSALDAPALRALGLLEAAEKVESAAAATDSTWTETIAAKLEDSGFTLSVGTVNQGRHVTIPPAFKIIVLSVAALLYLFTCYCLKRICQNAGTPPGFLIWLPVLQMIPLLRAARMSPWLLLLLTVIWVPVIILIPMLPPAKMFLGFALLYGLAALNLVVQIVWVFRIVKSCGKSPLVAVLMILPFTNLFAFLYLAFSSGESQAAPPAPSGPMRMSGLASA
jgi:hypothetical protein